MASAQQKAAGPPHLSSGPGELVLETPMSVG
jgi:hypothetical protein